MYGLFETWILYFIQIPLQQTCKHILFCFFVDSLVKCLLLSESLHLHVWKISIKNNYSYVSIPNKLHFDCGIHFRKQVFKPIWECRLFYRISIVPIILSLLDWLVQWTNGTSKISLSRFPKAFSFFNWTHSYCSSEPKVCLFWKQW